MSTFSPAAILYDAAGNPISTLTSAPTGTERALVVRNIPSGTQNVLPEHTQNNEASGNITNTESVTVDTNGCANARFRVNGTWTGTLLFEGTIDGVHWDPLFAHPTPTSQPNNAIGASTTTTGSWNTLVSGLKQIRIRGATITTGAAQVFIAASNATSTVSASIIGTASIISTGNSSTTPLGAGATFTGTPIDTLGFAHVSMSASSDVVSAIDGIEFQWSPDGVYWSTRGITDLRAARIGINEATDLSQRLHDRFFRIKYANGATPQGWFKLQVMLHSYPTEADTKGVDQQVRAGDDALLTKAVLTGKLPDGNFDDVPLLDHDTSFSFDASGLAVRPILDQYSLSAFHEQRVSIPYTLSDIVQKYGRDTRLISSSITGGGTVTDNLAFSGFLLSVTGANGDAARARTNEWYRYQTGRGQQVVLSCVHVNAGQTNQVRNWGYFDNNDGLGFRLVGTMMHVFRRTSTGEGGGALGTPYEEVVPRTAWNVDKMDGTGFSGVNLDVTKGSIYEIRFQWLGVGIVQFFINTNLVHQMVHPNMLPYPFMRTATLPMTWEVYNTGISSAGGFDAICGHVTSQSGEFPPTSIFSAVAAPKATTTAAEIPLLSVRCKSLFNTVDNRASLLPKLLSFSESVSNRAYVFVRLNPTLTGPVWTSVDTNSAAEYDTTATAITGGTALWRGTLTALGDRLFEIGGLFSLGGRTIRRDAYSGVSDIITISIQRVNNQNPSVDASLTWHEVR